MNSKVSSDVWVGAEGFLKYEVWNRVRRQSLCGKEGSISWISV